MKPRQATTACIPLAVICCLARASGEPAATAPVAIPAMISRLADDSFPVREQASKDILARGREHPEEVQKALVEAYRKSPDPEIRFRSKSILTQTFLESVGYLGVHYQAREFVDAEGERRVVVGVGVIEPDSPAKAAGLREGDLIIGVDGTDLRIDVAGKDFARRIQAAGAGGHLMLQVSRGNEVLNMKVTLGTRPATAIVNPDAEALFKERMRKLEKEPEKD